MNIFSKCYCRTFQFVMKYAMRLMNFPIPEIIHGLDTLPDQVQKEGINSILIVTDDFLHNKGKLIEGLKAGLEE